MERRYEIENLRRSLGMLRPGVAAGLSREQALELLRQLQDVERRMEQLKHTLRKLADEA